ncbi:MAG: TonB-dependent receptor plug domain-containing protein [Gemmatimonadaceae bacterium]|nr:TonB-dependent receptor plug domain-containing protein [Gemmatimonadaceae bacterium]
MSMPCLPHDQSAPRSYRARQFTMQRVASIVALLTLPASVSGQQTDSTKADSTRRTTLGTVRVEGRVDDLRGIAQSASQGRVGRRDLRNRPMSREGEVLENIPGMILTQHSGDGKANQMFVRGFNLDHGTDFQTRIESMPINMPTHAHGQGYSDLNMLIPELVDHLEYKLGPYYAELGDFGSAGGATLQLVRSLARPLAQVDVGAWGFARTVAAASTRRGRHSYLVGGEAKQYDGPWDRAQGLRKFSGMGRWTWQGERDEVSLLGLTYSNRWNATDQIPSRLVEQRSLSRFGQVDQTLGGDTERHSLSLQWKRALNNGTLRVDSYAMRYNFNLFSNFTYLLENETAGDQLEQVDHRTVGGMDIEYTRPTNALGAAHLVRVGTQGRFDDAAVALHGTTARVRYRTVRADDVEEGSLGAWTSIESRWTSSIRTIAGLRGDAYRFRVDSDNPLNSGTRSATIASPKFSLVYAPTSTAELYVGGGLGFHSNDARGSTITVDPVSGDAVDRVDPLVRSRGGEIGVRTSASRGFRSSASLWVLDLDSELLFVGDAGTTEPQGRSRRAGVTVASFWQPYRALTVDADISFTRARFVDEPAGVQSVAGALNNVIAAGVTWAPVSRRPFASLRVRHLGGYSLIEDNSVRGTPTTLVNGALGTTVGRARVQASVFNLLGGSGRDIQYFYASRVAGEPSGGVEDVHYHPVEPRQLRLSVSFGM